jgi:hypothetical protein
VQLVRNFREQNTGRQANDRSWIARAFAALTLVATTGAQAMDSDASGWLWLVIDVLMVAVLGVALLYGSMLWRRRRSRALEQVSGRATVQLYEREAERERKAEADRMGW